MRAVVFSGPSLTRSHAPSVPDLAWRPPVRQGDVYKVALSRPDVIGIVDGYFEAVPTVWHKEILWAMAQGIHVYGAASIGALRAAELADFGMVGIGDIYRQYREGILQGDDEVAVLHGPAEVGYVQLTQPMVNVRATLRRAFEAGVIDAEAAAALTDAAKALFYKERTYELLMEQAAEHGLAPEVLARLAAWLPAGQVDQKRQDAMAMIEAIDRHLARGVLPMQVFYKFQPTIYWDEARRRAETELKPARRFWGLFPVRR